MELYRNRLYMEDVVKTGEVDLPWEKLRGRRVMLSGATGLIGSFLADVILEKNRRYTCRFRNRRKSCGGIICIRLCTGCRSMIQRGKQMKAQHRTANQQTGAMRQWRRLRI